MDKRIPNAIRFLSMDAVQKANSGHPGMPMGMADIASVLFTEFIKINPKDPKWVNRDRFVLSNGHGSMLIYSLLYLLGYKEPSLSDIKKFRKVGSKTPGHPEYKHTIGIETTTGPLGQGLGNAVGMALGEKILSNKFGSAMINHYTYVFAGDGCLMEGISHEALSLAGHLNLNKMIVFYDDNDISIDGPTSLSFTDDTEKRIISYGWEYIKISGHNHNQIRKAIKKAQKSNKPTMIACKTSIGYGSPNKAGSHESHGAALGESEIALTRKKLNSDFCYLSGEDGTALAFLAQGGHGCISVTANVAPLLCSQMHLEWRNGNIKKAQEINLQLSNLHDSLFVESSPGPVKYAAELIGLCKSDTRLPLAEINENTKTKEISIED